uniref:Serine carboxypeptidase S10 family protein n=1 Tax=Rhizophora mucronata TaxID=61149 RepID=A0A2P2K6T3_RHIMU
MFYLFVLTSQFTYYAYRLMAICSVNTGWMTILSAKHLIQEREL